MTINIPHTTSDTPKLPNDRQSARQSSDDLIISAIMAASSEASKFNPMKTILILFYMDNCPACEMSKKHLKDRCTDQEKLRIVYINVRDSGVIRSIVVDNEIRSIPTIYTVSLQENKVLSRIEGYSENAFDAFFDNNK